MFTNVLLYKRDYRKCCRISFRRETKIQYLYVWLILVNSMSWTYINFVLLLAFPLYSFSFRAHAYSAGPLVSQQRGAPRPHRVPVRARRPRDSAWACPQIYSTRFHVVLCFLFISDRSDSITSGRKCRKRMTTRFLTPVRAPKHVFINTWKRSVGKRDFYVFFGDVQCSRVDDDEIAKSKRRLVDSGDTRVLSFDCNAVVVYRVRPDQSRNPCLAAFFERDTIVLH